MTITSQNQLLFQWYLSLRKDDILPIKRWTALSICADLGLEGQDFKTLERQSSRPSGSTTLQWRISRFYPPIEFLNSGHLLLDLSTEKLEGANLKLHGAVSFLSLVWGISSESDSQRFYAYRIWVDLFSLQARYFYLICFATYAKEFGPGGFEKSFVSVG